MYPLFQMWSSLCKVVSPLSLPLTPKMDSSSALLALRTELMKVTLFLLSRHHKLDIALGSSFQEADEAGAFSLSQHLWKYFVKELQCPSIFYVPASLILYLASHLGIAHSAAHVSYLFLCLSETQG